MLTYKQALLHSTLSGSDTQATYLFASLNAIPVTRMENKTTRTLQKLYAGVTETWSKPPADMLNPSAWSLATEAEGEGFLLCDQVGHEEDLGHGVGAKGCPMVFLEDGQACRLLVWQQQGFLVRF
jgi:hypothetical protein